METQFIIRRIVLALAALLPVVAQAAPAQESASAPAAVVELFTSQGCNSCPPADRLFSEYAQRKDVVALAYHVGYWDYLGWRDMFATEENTARQKDYMRSFKASSVYTPQAVVNGRVHVNGADRGALDGAIAANEAAAERLSVPIKVNGSGDSVIIEAGGVDPAKFGTGREAHLLLVHFEQPRTVTIDRGENEGQNLTYWNAVTNIQTAGMWHGQPVRYELPRKVMGKKGGCAVLLQEVDKDGLPGAILGAVVVRNHDAPTAP